MNEQRRKRLGNELRLVRRRIGTLGRCGVPGVEADLKAAGLLVDQALYSLGMHPPAPPAPGTRSRRRAGAVKGAR
jgi:hypothetical protein